MERKTNRKYLDEVKELKKLYDTDPEIYTLLNVLISFYTEKEEFKDVLNRISIHKATITKLREKEAEGVNIKEDEDTIIMRIDMYIQDLFRMYDIFKLIDIIISHIQEVNESLFSFLNFEERCLLKDELNKFINKADKKLQLAYDFTNYSLSELKTIHKK